MNTILYMLIQSPFVWGMIIGAAVIMKLYSWIRPHRNHERRGRRYPRGGRSYYDDDYYYDHERRRRGFVFSLVVVFFLGILVYGFFKSIAIEKQEASTPKTEESNHLPPGRKFFEDSANEPETYDTIAEARLDSNATVATLNEDQAATTANLFKGDFYVQLGVASSVERGLNKRAHYLDHQPAERVHLARSFDEEKYPFKILFGPFSDEATAREFTGQADAYVRDLSIEELILIERLGQ